MLLIHKQKDEYITRFLKKNFGTWCTHWHKEIEIVQVLEEPASIVIGKTFYKLHKGDFIALHSCEPHGFITEEKQSKLMQSCKFKSALISSVTRNFKFPKSVIRKEEIDLIPGLYDRLCDAFDELGKHADGKGSQQLADCYTVLLFSLLSEHFPSDSVFSSYDSEALLNLEILLNYIDRNYSRNISLTDLASEINYSVNYVSKIFKKYSSMTYKEYLDNARINHAVEYIKTGQKSFTEIASLCGFDNIRTFNNVFKKIMNCTPSEFKQKIFQNT